MSNDIKHRTLEFVKYKGITMKSFENKCGLSSGYVTSMRKGFGREKLNNVLTAFPELNRDWLLYGEGNMLREATPATSTTVPTPTSAPSADDTRINRLIDTIATLQSVINDQAATISALKMRIAQLENCR